MLHDAVLPNALFDSLAAGAQGLGEFGLFVARLGEDVGCAFEFDGEHCVARDEEAEDGGVVAGAESRAHETCAVVEGVAVAG